MLGLVVALRLLLPFVKIKTLLQWLAPSRIPLIADQHTLDKAVRYTDALLWRMRFPLRGSCIPRSLALYYFATRCGLPVHVHCGVRRVGEALQGHAWLTLNGSPFLEEGNPDYAVTFSFPDSERAEAASDFLAIETVHLTQRFPQAKGYLELLRHPFRRKEMTALRDLNIRIHRGEVFGLLGPNGAGKTTLMKILSTLILPTDGKVYVHGYDTNRHEREVKRLIGYVVSDERSFYWRLTGRQNLRFFAALHNLTRQEAEVQIQKVLELVGLREKADDQFMNYSTGMRQRLAIARGLLSNAEVLLLDEPTKGLDVYGAQLLRRFIREELVQKQGKTVVLATHYLEEAEQLCDRIAILDRGELRACGKISEITAAFNGKAAFSLTVRSVTEGIVSHLYTIKGVKEIAFLPAQGNHGSSVINVTVEEKETTISHVIEAIVFAGGKVTTCRPHEVSLDEVFHSVLDPKETS